MWWIGQAKTTKGHGNHCTIQVCIGSTKDTYIWYFESKLKTSIREIWNSFGFIFLVYRCQHKQSHLERQLKVHFKIWFIFWPFILISLPCMGIYTCTCSQSYPCIYYVYIVSIGLMYKYNNYNYNKVIVLRKRIPIIALWWLYVNHCWALMYLLCCVLEIWGLKK